MPGEKLKNINNTNQIIIIQKAHGDKIEAQNNEGYYENESPVIKKSPGKKGNVGQQKDPTLLIQNIQKQKERVQYIDQNIQKR